jgi:hypothetical protein
MDKLNTVLYDSSLAIVEQDTSTIEAFSSLQNYYRAIAPYNTEWIPYAIFYPTNATANVGVYEIQVNCYALHSDNYSDASIQVFFDGALMETYGPHHFIVDDYNGSDPAAWWEVCTITVTNGRCMISNDKPTPLVREKIALDKVSLPRK